MERNEIMREILTENRDLCAEQKKLTDVFLAASSNTDAAKLHKASDRLDEIEERLATLQSATWQVLPRCRLSRKTG